jgi:teichuronic acid biosynthesis glycosyltransferase TuaC
VETFGVALVEALSCGLPVVATRCGGPDDIVEPSQGVLVPPGDVDALAKACLGMRAGWSGYDRTQIRQRCVERFGEAAIVGRLDEVYRRVARPGADRGRPVGLG